MWQISNTHAGVVFSARRPGRVLRPRDGSAGHAIGSVERGLVRAGSCVLELWGVGGAGAGAARSDIASQPRWDPQSRLVPFPDSIWLPELWLLSVPRPTRARLYPNA